MSSLVKKVMSSLLACTMMLACCVTANAQSEKTDSGISLDFNTGMLDIDYEKYLSQHDVVYNNPIINAADGATVGNGRMGGMIWNENGIKMEITNVDAAPYTALPSGLVNFYCDPVQQPVEGEFQQRLNLYDGTVTTTYGSGLDLTFMGDPNSEVLGIHVKDSRQEQTPAYVDLSLWLDKLDADPEGPFTSRPYGNPSDPMPNKETWTNPEFHYTDKYAAISRGQEDPNNFGYTMAVTVDGAEFTVSEVGEGTDKKLRLAVKPSGEYTIWIVNPSRRQAENCDSKAAAEELIEDTLAAGYEKIYSDFTAYWHDFWSRCFVQYQNDDNPQMDYVENSWYLYQYLIGCGSRGEFPFHFINGVWRWDEQDESMWSWDYTSFNERTFAYTHYATNRLELTDSYYDMFINNIDAFERYVYNRFYVSDHDDRFEALDGAILIPERYTWDGEKMVGYDGAENGCPYTTEIYATSAEIAMGMFEKYKYTYDEDYLREKAYPVMKGVCQFIEKFLEVDEDGTYFIRSGNALETYWDQKNPITDLAAFRSILERTIEASEILGVDSDMRTVWEDILENLAPFKTTETADGTGEKYLPHDPPASQLMNSQNPELEIIWPFNRTGIGYDDWETAVNTYNEKIMPINIWSPEPIYAARLGMGDESFENLKNMILRSQSHANGIHDDDNGMFESNALIITAVNKELLQSYNDKIRVFPAVVSDQGFNSKFTLLARNGFLVTSEYADKEVKYIAIVSKYGNEATVCNPWEGEELTVKNLETNEVITSGSDAEITFSKEKDGKYIIERNSKPVSEYSHETLTGTANNNLKKLIGEDGRIRVLGNAYMQPIEKGETDDTSDNISFVGGWTSESHPGCYNDTAKYSSSKGAYAEFRFSGKSVQLVMPLAVHQGMFNVYVDNKLIAENVDSYSPQNTKQNVVFAATDFSDGVHTMKVEVAGAKNPDSLGSTVTIDAIIVSDEELPLVDEIIIKSETGENIIDTPDGTLKLNAEIIPEELSSAELSWSVSNEDGTVTSVAAIDQNGVLTAKENGTVVVTATAKDGSNTKGTITITITNQITDKEKWDDRDERITFTGSWAPWTDSRHYMTTEMYSANTGDSFEFDFFGRGFGLIVFESTRTGMMDIYLDGELLEKDVDTFNNSISGGVPQVLAYSNDSLPVGDHHVKVVVTGNKNQQSDYPEIKLDAVEIYLPVDADKTELQSLYDANKDKKHGIYNDESWSAFEEALANAKSVLDAEYSTEEEVAQAVEKLNSAIENLKSDYEIEKIDDRDERITLTGNWSPWTDGRHYMTTEMYSANTGDSFEFDFDGVGFGIVVFESVKTGMMDIYVDGELYAENVDTFNNSNPSGTPQVLAFSTTDLDNGNHHVKVVVTGKMNEQSQYPEIKLDAVEIYRKDDTGYQKGDADRNGKVEIYDATLIQSYIIKNLSESQVFDVELADVNGDNEINITDATLVQLIVSGKIKI